MVPETLLKFLKLAKDEEKAAQIKLEEARSTVWRIEREIREVTEGFPVGSRIMVVEDTCGRGCCNHIHRGKVISKDNVGRYVVLFDGRESPDEFSLNELRKEVL